MDGDYAVRYYICIIIYYIVVKRTARRQRQANIIVCGIQRSNDVLHLYCIICWVVFFTIRHYNTHRYMRIYIIYISSDIIVLHKIIYLHVYRAHIIVVAQYYYAYLPPLPSLKKKYLLKSIL